MNASKWRSASGRSGSLKRQAGIDLIQLSVAVGIIAFILSIGFLVVPTIMTNIKSNSETSDLQQEVSQAQRVFGSGVPAAGLTNDLAISLKLMAADRVSGDKTILNRFGGTVTWSAVNYYASQDAVQLESTGYSSEACLRLVPNVQSLFVKVSVGATVVKDLQQGKVLNAADLASACKAASNTITYVFSL
ncbi:type 4 pilus major pilin [Chromobacterium subtsugae]|uniref:type 4 pilus major pilin n=1 Tax=Chromobacterium subtsugae TaxID=251747 RepID=UPI00064143CC|nr:type 4 pilus major pilin [Chromobacterium subtsugae]